MKSKKVKSFNDWAYLAVQKYTNYFTKYAQEVLKDKDPENLHQMRVGMRKLRTALKGFNLSLKLPRSITSKQIGRIARTLGKLRDLDVLLEIINQKYVPKLPPLEKEQLAQVLVKIKDDRKGAFNKVKSTLKGKKYYQIKTSLKKWLKKPKFRLGEDIKIEDILNGILLASVDKLFAHPGWQVGQTETDLYAEKVDQILSTEGVKLHDLRKEAKGCRYQMELFSHFYGEKYLHYLNQIKKVQTVLGNLQDDAVLTEVITEKMGEDILTAMPIFSQKMQDDRYQQWQQWQELQSFWLENHRVEQLREIITSIKSQQEQPNHC